MVIVSLGMRMIYMVGAECRAERIADSRMGCDPLPERTFFYSQYDSRYVGRDWLPLSRDRCFSMHDSHWTVVDNALERLPQ